MQIRGFREMLALALSVPVSCIAQAQPDSPDVQLQLEIRDVQLLVARDLPAPPERFLVLCSASNQAAIWCGGYLTGLMNSLGVGEFHPCHPPVDVGRFIYEGVWNVAWDWLSRQPQDSEVRLKDAIVAALNELEGCDL